MKSIFGMTSYGLEAVGAEELAEVPGITVTETDYRRITAQCDESALAALLDLRTLDDLYIDIATWDNIKHTRDMLPELEERFRKLDLKLAAKTCAMVRPIPAEPIFSVTSSFVGKRNYNTDEIKTAVAEAITIRQNWRYTPDDREADLNVRLFIVKETAYIGLRLGKHPLHERDYKRIERPGALKPSVAAAMLRLADVQPGMKLLDPCCGTGSILIEGSRMGATAHGGDIEAEAVKATQSNIAAAKVQVEVEKWDARKLPLADHSTDRIVTNLPWGRQIAVDDELVSFYGDVCREMERVLAPGGKLAVLTSLPHLVKFKGLQPDQAIDIALFGQHPTIAIYTAAD